MSMLRITLPFAAALMAYGALAQDVTADAYFNQASREFVKVDKMTAMRTLDRGLQAYPGDPKLLKLAEELLKDEEKKQQQQQQQQQQDQQGKDKEKQDQQGKNDQQQDQQGKDQKPQDKQQEKPSQEKNEQPEQADNKKKEEQRKGEQTSNIAPQDAMRMLDALERSEKDVQEKVRLRRRPATRQNIEKDW